jgi:hypothetical protein
MRRTRSYCCARDGNGHVAAAPRKPIWGKRRVPRRRKSNPRYRPWGRRPAHRARTLVRDIRASAFDLIELKGDDLRRIVSKRMAHPTVPVARWIGSR